MFSFHVSIISNRNYLYQNSLQGERLDSDLDLLKKTLELFELKLILFLKAFLPVTNNFKEATMKSSNCVSQRMSKYFIGFLMLGAAMGLLVIGITILPIFGFVMAVPVAALAIIIFRLHLNDQCEIDFSS